MVPSGWNVKSFGGVVKLSKIKYDPKKAGKCFPCIELEHIAQETGQIIGSTTASSLGSIKNKFNIGDVIFGKLRPYLRKYATPSFEGVCSSEIWVFNPTNEITNPYLFQFVQSDKFITEANKSAGSKMPRADWGVVSEMLMLIPSLPEQRKIAEILSTWDKAISTTERLIDNSKQKKKALMQQLLTGKKRLLDDSDKPFVGEWEEFTVGTIAKLTAGGTPSTKHSEYWGGKIPWMNSGEVNLKQVFSVEGRITDLGLNNSSTKEIPENSILIALAGQGKTRGTIAINRIKLCTNQSIAAIMPDEARLSAEFLYFNLDNRYKELRAMSTGDGGRGGLNLNILKSIKLKLPLVKEQEMIATVLINADKEIELLEQQFADLKQEKKALMQQLLTGKCRVKVDEKEVA